MLQDATPNSNNRTAIGVIDRRQNIYWVKAHTLLGLRQQLRQLSDIRRDPSRLIAREQLGCQAVTFVGRKRQKKPQQVSAGASFWVAKGDQIPNADTTLDSLYEDSVAQRGQKVRPIQVNHSALITRGRPALGSTRKRSADIIGRCGEYTEGQAAANQGEQHGRFHAVDLLPVDVKLVCEVGHGYSPCNTLPRPLPST
jgi:hypothetical protein